MSPPARASWPLEAAALAIGGALAAAVFAGLTGLVALIGLRRLAGDIDPRDLDPGAVVAWFWYFRHDPQVRRWLGSGALFAAAAFILLGAAIARALQPALHGAARWAGEPELRRAGLRARTGILLGRKGGAPLVFGGPEHVMLYAPTRTGKGVGVVIPNLLTWPDSVVVLDVKRENWEASAGFRAAHGQAVFLFDPLDPEGRTARYNPLGHINREDPAQVLDELQKIAAMLFPTPAHGDPFWAESARTGFIGLGAYVAATPELPFAIGAIYQELTRGDPRTRLPALVRGRQAGEHPLPAACVQALGDFTASSENTFTSVRQTLTSRLNLWLNPRVCAATEASDFDLRTLRSRRQSLYLAASPDNLARVAPLYGLLAQQLISMTVRERPTPARHPLQVLLLLDEFARLGHAPVLAHAFSYIAGYGVRILPVLQSPAQLRAEYGPELAEEIFSNCGLEIAFAPKELKVAQELSERLGYRTVRSPSRSRPAGLSRGPRSLSESDQKRALRLPQELTQMGPGELIILKAGLPPVLGRKIVFHLEGAFTRRVRPPPPIPPRPLPAPRGPTPHEVEPTDARYGPEEPAPPPPGASLAEIEAWTDRYIDAAAQLREPNHGR